VDVAPGPAAGMRVRTAQRTDRGRRVATILLVSALACLLYPPPARSDGGRVRLLEPAGPFVVTVFSTPDPLRVGAADLSVLVQDRAGGEPLLDAEVVLEVTPPSGTDVPPVRLVATRAQATNKLLYAASFAPAHAGAWPFAVTVRRGRERGRVRGVLVVEPAGSGLADIWVYLALPPAAAAVYALRAYLVRRRRRARQPAAAASRSVANS
jgi:hypothetical protein